MHTDRLDDMYRRWLLEVWGAGDYALDDELLDENFVDHNAYPGQPAGRAGDPWAAEMVRTAFPDLRFTADVVFAHDDLVTGRWTMTGTHTGPLTMLGLPPTGRPVVMTGQEIFRAAGGRAVRRGLAPGGPARHARPARSAATGPDDPPGGAGERPPLPPGARPREVTPARSALSCERPMIPRSA